MSEQTSERPWSVTVRLDEIAETGRHVDLEASADIRAALAKPAGVEAVERLVASFDLTRRGRDGLHVSGEVSATVRQNCVVTLESFLNEINEEVDVDFAPAGETVPKAMDPDDEMESSSADEPEPLIGNNVDLGLLATEFLILGVDPYPRKPDVSFEPPQQDDAAAHPFAGLQAWNKKGTVKE
jgi:hypothetical protein